ncbi:hypothetical protein ACFQNF_19740 [Iodobacter arcticus]|uniref:Uncharacterized protein n=1 Tax=Iodobacter arcticus TaxID=590593 RepID=A0ABW2R319_9NEIS
MEGNDKFEYLEMPEDIYLVYQKDGITSKDLDVLVRYWTRKDGKFAETVQEIAKSHGIASSKVSVWLDRLSVSVTLGREELTCINCGVAPEIRNRSDYQRCGSRVSMKLDKDGFCKECASKHKPLDPSGKWVLGHLTRTQLDELVEAYYSQEDCAKLVQSYEINLNPVEFAKDLNCTMKYGKCRHCSESYSDVALSQGEYCEGVTERHVICTKCEHQARVDIERYGTPQDQNYGLSFVAVEYTTIKGMPQCECKQCKAERNRDPKNRRQIILNTYKQPKVLVDIQDLSLHQIVCLLGMLWSRTSEDNPDILLSSNIERMPLTPGDHNKWDWMRLLTKESVIYVDAEKSPLNAFEEEDISSYFMSRVVYALNVTLNQETACEPAELLSALVDKFRKGFWQSRWTEELLPVWKDIGVDESIAYVEERAEHYNLDIPNQDKLREIFLGLLDDFSVAEIWYMISVAYMNAAAFSKTKACNSKSHATNIIPSKIVNLAKQPRSKIKSWGRIKNLPQSAVTQALFDIILPSENDAGFNHIPRQTWKKLLNKHLARNADHSQQIFMERYPLAPDEVLRELAEEYGDWRIDTLVEYAIAARARLNSND